MKKKIKERYWNNTIGIVLLAQLVKVIHNAPCILLTREKNQVKHTTDHSVFLCGITRLVATPMPWK